MSMKKIDKQTCRPVTGNRVMKKIGIENEYLIDERRRSALILLRCLARSSPQEEATPRDNCIGLPSFEEDIQNLRFKFLNTDEKRRRQTPQENEIVANFGRSDYIFDRPYFYSPCTMNVPAEYRRVDIRKSKGTLCFHMP